jgi:hypothetical protein
VLAWLFLVFLAFGQATSGKAQEVSGEIHGSVLGLGGPVAHAEVRAREQRGKTAVQSATTAQDGSYRLERIPSGTYDLKISADGFHPTEIRDVQIGGPGIKVLAAVRVEGEVLIADCGSDRRPDYYRPLAWATAAGAVGRAVASENGALISGANVTLYVRGRGRIGSQMTRRDGRFLFVGLQARQEYWVSISREGYFSEEVRHLTVLLGLEAVYAPITMEACSPGRCQPHLKTIHVLPSCA